MCLYRRLICHSNSSVFYKGHMFAEVGNISSPLGREMCWRQAGANLLGRRGTGNILSSSTYAPQVAEFFSGATAASAALAGMVPTRSGYTLVEMADYTYIHTWRWRERN